MLHVQHCNAMEKCWTVRCSSVQRPIMTNVTWSRFDQSAQQLVVGHTTIEIIAVNRINHLSKTNLQVAVSLSLSPCPSFHQLVQQIPWNQNANEFLMNTIQWVTWRKNFNIHAYAVTKFTKCKYFWLLTIFPSKLTTWPASQFAISRPFCI